MKKSNRKSVKKTEIVDHKETKADKQDGSDRVLISKKLIVFLIITAVCVVGIILTSNDTQPDQVKALYMSKQATQQPLPLNSSGSIDINLNNLISPTPGSGSTLKIK